MGKKRIAAALALILALCLLPSTAFAEAQTATPELSEPEAFFDPDNTDENGKLIYEDQIGYTVVPGDGTQSYYEQYASDSTVRLYASSTGGSELYSPVTVEMLVNSSNLECVTFIIPAPTADTTYWLSVQEPGKTESDRAPFTVKMFNATGVLLQRIGTMGISDIIPTADGDSAAKALVGLVAYINAHCSGLNISASTAGAVVSYYVMPNYGNPGRIGAVVSLSNGDRISVGCTIGAEAYTGGKTFELPAGSSADFVFGSSEVHYASGDSTDNNRSALLNVVRTSDSSWVYGYQTFMQGFSVSTSASDSTAAMPGLTVGAYTCGIEMLELKLTKPTAATSTTLHLWYTPIAGGSVSSSIEDVPQYIGSFTLTANLYDTLTPMPQVESSSFGRCYPILVTLTNSDVLANATFRVYNVPSGSIYNGTLNAQSVVRRVGDKLIVGYAVNPITSSAFGITATLPGLAESLFCYISISTDGTLSSAYVDETGGIRVITQGSDVSVSSGSTSADLTVSPLDVDDDEYAELAAAAGGNVAAAYELTINSGTLSGNTNVKFYVDSAYANKQVLILHKTSSGTIEQFTVTVDAAGYAEAAVSSMSPFMVKTNVTTTETPAVSRPGNPYNVTVNAGDTATFSLSGDPGATGYQWYINRGDGKGFVRIKGATGIGYTTSEVNAGNNGFRYRRATNYGSYTVDSDIFTLYVTGGYAAVPDTGDGAMIWPALLMMCAVEFVLARRKRA